MRQIQAITVPGFPPHALTSMQRMIRQLTVAIGDKQGIRLGTTYFLAMSRADMVVVVVVEFSSLMRNIIAWGLSLRMSERIIKMLGVQVV